MWFRIGCFPGAPAPGPGIGYIRIGGSAAKAWMVVKGQAVVSRDQLLPALLLV